MGTAISHGLARLPLSPPGGYVGSSPPCPSTTSLVRQKSPPPHFLPIFSVLDKGEGGAAKQSLYTVFFCRGFVCFFFPS